MEDIMRSSSSRREMISENRQLPKKIGCMSGIFHLLQHHHLTPKRLTSASGKKEKTVISPKKTKPPAVIPVNGKETNTIKPPENLPSAPDLRRISCDVPRSPTLPPGIRRSNSVNSSENFRRPPALVARLMGLEEMPSPSPGSSVEKRQKLLGALEKCDEDLKALKKIIEAIRMAEGRCNSVAKTRRESFGDSVGVTRAREEEKNRRESLHEFVLGSRYKGRAGLGARERNVKDLDGGDSLMMEKSCSDVTAEQPSPVSVLDEISSSPSERRFNTLDKEGVRCRLKDDINCSYFHRIMVESLPQFVGCKGGKPIEYLSSAVKTSKRRSASTSSKAMVETLNEVWKDGIWEERWEFGRIGVVLEGHIFRELVEEIVRELGCYCKCSLPYYNRSLPLEACRKRLCF